jgi:hypothetical protein
MYRLAGWLYLAVKGWLAFCFDGIGPGEQPSAGCDCSLRTFEAHPPQMTSTSGMVSILQAPKSEWYQGKKADRAAQLWPGYVQFLVYIVQKPPAFQPERRRKKNKKKLYMKKSRQIRNAMLFDLSRLTRDHI